MAISDMTCQKHVERNAHAPGTLETILSKGTTQKGGRGKTKMETGARGKAARVKTRG